MEEKPVIMSKEISPDINQYEIEKKIPGITEQYMKIPAIFKAFELLDELPSDLKYHKNEHTKDVLHEALLFGLIDGLNEDHLKLLAEACVWHDIGFIVKKNNNEIEAVKLYKSYDFGYDDEHIKNIEEMILDTKLEDTENGPKTRMKNIKSGYLLDADVSNFGREDFMDKLNLVAEELNVNMQDKKAKLEFLKYTLLLLENHDWYTESARKLRQKQKLINITKLKEEIKSLLQSQNR